MLLTAGQCADSPIAQDLVLDWLEAADYCLADRAYDTDDFLELLSRYDVIPVIPSHGRRAAKRDYDEHIYKDRHLIECFIGKIKHFRRIFTRFDKLEISYTSFLYFAFTLIWLR